MKSKNSKNERKPKEWEMLNRKKTDNGELCVDDWIIKNVLAPNMLIPYFSMSMGLSVAVGCIPCAIPMKDNEIKNGIAHVGGNFNSYTDTWRIACIKTIRKKGMIFIGLIDGYGEKSTEVKRKSYENNFNWDKWLYLNFCRQQSNLDGYYLIMHEYRRGMYLGATWRESLQALNQVVI